MEYERIHKVENGIISPSKLRMKLMGPHHQKKKDGSTSNSSRTSPSRLEDIEFAKNSLLATGDFNEEGQGDGNSLQQEDVVPRVNGDASRLKMQSAAESSNSSSVHPIRTYEEETLDYDSTSSFEFHNGEKSLHPATRSFSRPMSSKWNDAEKWIMSRQNVQPGNSRKTNLHNQGNRVPVTNVVRVALDSTGSDNKSSVKRVDFCQPASQSASGKFGFASNMAQPILGQGNGANMLIDLCPQSKDLTEVDSTGSCMSSVTEDTAGGPGIRAVSMRDMGTEMTPIPSQEPSRTATPVDSTTPIRSPTSSIPSTPRRGEPAPTPTEHPLFTNTSQSAENGKVGLSEQELKLKTRKEIVALGMQLGKMNIAAWASKDESENGVSGNETFDADEVERIEYAKRAAAWEEAEKSKCSARFKREEIKIQAWESEQKAKLEAEMRKIEAKVEGMRAQAHAKLVKKIALARQKSEEKRAAAEARKDRRAEKTKAQVDYIRQTGRIPSSAFVCCGWS